MSRDATTAGTVRSKLRRLFEHWQGRLFRKYAALLIALVATALTINSVIEAYVSYLENRESLLSLQHEKAIGAAQTIEQYIKEIEGQLGWTTHASLLPGPSSIEQRRFDFLRLLRQAPAITELAYIDADGKEQLRVSRLSMDVASTGIDRSADPAFAVAREARRYASPIYFRKESEPYMTLAVTGASRRSGVTIAEVNLKFIWDVITRIRIGNSGLAYAVDDKGLLIAHPDIGLVLRKSDVSSLQQIKAALASRQSTPAEQTIIAHDRNGRSVLTAFARVNPLGWTVFVEQPLSEAYQPIYASIARSGLVLASGLALATLAGLWFAQRMAVPIRALSQGAAKLGAGDLDHKIEVATGDEVEALAASFNAMGDRLKESYTRLEHRVEERTAELGKSLTRQTAISYVLGVISRNPNNLAPVLKSIIVTATNLCEADQGQIMRKHADGRWSVDAMHGYSDDYLTLLEKSDQEPGPGSIAARVVTDSKTHHIVDVLADPDYSRPEAQRTAGYRTLLGVPLKRQGELIGIILLGRKRILAFTDHEIEMVETFADQAVIAIENERLFEAEQTRTRELQEALQRQTATSDVLTVISRSPTDARPVFDIIGERAEKLCDAEISVVSIVDGDEIRLAGIHGVSAGHVELFRASFPMPVTRQTATARAIRTGKLVHIPDVLSDADYDNKALASGTGYRNCLAVPLHRKSQVIGAIFVARTAPGAFSDSQVQLLKIFADQAVIAIENARLFEEVQSRTADLQRSVSEMRALSEVGQAVSSTLDLDTVLGTILSHACDFSQASGGAIYVLDERRGTLTLEAGHSMSDALMSAVREHPIKIGDPVVGECAATGLPVQLADLTERQEHPLFGVLDRSGVRALLAVPLVNQSATVGVLLVRRSRIGAFEPETVELLQSFASQSSIAINNARLFQELEEKSRQLAVASQHKSQFLANMSHELRTPLNAILGYTELIQDGVYGEPSDKIKSILDRVQTNGRHLLGLINDVLDLSKIEAGQLVLKLEDYALDAVIQTVVSSTESLAAAKNLRLEVALAKNMPVARGDERRLTQVVLNLVGNAIKFTDTGRIRIAASPVAHKFVIRVDDTGPGIPPSEHARIFEEFHQVDSSNTKKKGGSGLGLAISKRIVELHGGRISVESEVGKGASFRVHLPIRVDKQRGVA